MSNNNEFSIEQFEKSLNKYRKKELESRETGSNINLLFCGYDNELEKNINELRCDEECLTDENGKKYEAKKDLSILILRSTYLNKLSEYHDSLSFMLMNIESPIEKAMLSAFMIIGYDFSNTITCRYGKQGIKGDFKDFKWEAGDKFFPEYQSNILIEPQFKIENYRVDFLLTYEKENKLSRLIIECDGHEFHEKTKEQVARDKKRERFLQDCGYRIHRYSGSEIFKDVFDSAYQALKSVTK
jgi:very-short-patch-repair endonuclease